MKWAMVISLLHTPLFACNNAPRDAKIKLCIISYNGLWYNYLGNPPCSTFRVKVLTLSKIVCLSISVDISDSTNETTE